MFRGRIQECLDKDSSKNIIGSITFLDLRGPVPLTRHFYSFEIPIPLSTESNFRNPDKVQLRATILEMHKHNLSYRTIGESLGIHWTRVGQIVRNVE